MWNVSVLDVGEFSFELFFRRVYEQFRLLAENNLADFDKAGHLRLAHLVCIEFVYATAIVELNAEAGFFLGHDLC